VRGQNAQVVLQVLVSDTVTGLVCSTVVATEKGLRPSSDGKVYTLKLDEHGVSGSFHVAIGATEMQTGERYFLKAYMSGKESPSQMFTVHGDVLCNGLATNLVQSFTDYLSGAPAHLCLSGMLLQNATSRRRG